jgi:hypothetical protein
MAGGGGGEQGVPQRPWDVGAPMYVGLNCYQQSQGKEPTEVKKSVSTFQMLCAG